jgi:hypothetical protein
MVLTRQRARSKAGTPRLDWRDPDMPALRDYEEYDSLGNVIGRGVEVVKSKVVTKVAWEDLRESAEPDWRNDPSYSWARPARRRR